MGEIKDIAGVFYIEFYARGLLYSQVAGQTYQEAQQLLKTVESAIARGEALTWSRTITLEAFKDRFLRQISNVYPYRSIQRYQTLLKHFQGFLRDSFPQIEHVGQITPFVIEKYKFSLCHHEAKVQRVNFSLLLLREIFECAIALGFINDNPTCHVVLRPWWEKRIALTPRSQKAKEMLSKGLLLGPTAQRLFLTDVAKVLYFANFIPLRREDMYNCDF